MFSANSFALVRRRRLALTILLFATLNTGVADPEATAIESPERILETAQAFLTETLKADDGAPPQIEIGRLDNRLRLTRCAQAPTAQLAPGARLAGNVTVNIRCAQPVAWSIFVPVRIARYTEAVVATRALARRQIIRSDDVRLERIDAGKLASGYFDDPSAVIGLETRRALIPHQALTDAHVTQRQLIERGQQVTLFSARPGLTVRMKGEALEEGAVGQRIRVRNGSSKRIVEGYVEPSGAIRVAF